jgi:putative transposase
LRRQGSGEKEWQDRGRKWFSADIKATVALETIRGHKKANEIASRDRVHPTQIVQWKKQVLDELPEMFSSHGRPRESG